MWIPWLSRGWRLVRFGDFWPRNKGWHLRVASAEGTFHTFILLPISQPSAACKNILISVISFHEFFISLQHQLLLQLLRLDSDRSLRLINDSSRLLRQLLQQLDRLSPCGRRKWPRQRPQQLAHGLSKLFGLNPFLVAPKFGQIWTTNFRSHRPLVLKLFSWI